MSNNVERVNYDYTPNHKAGNTVTPACGIAYFMTAFSDFVKGTSLLQFGQSDLAACMGNLINTLNDVKNARLLSFSQGISNFINSMRDKHGDDLTKAQNELADMQSRYKLLDTQLTSIISSLTPSSQQDVDATTAIAQNNAQVYQIAMYILATLSTLVQLMKAA